MGEKVLNAVLSIVTLVTHKLLSGRFLLTLAAAFILVKASQGVVFSPDKIEGIILGIVMSYFAVGNLKQKEETK